MDKNYSKVIVIGIDAAGPYGLTNTQKDLIKRANYLAAPRRVLGTFLEWWNKQNIQNGTPEIFESDKPNELIKWLASKKGTSVIISSGDPLWFGIGRLLLESFPSENISFHPSPTSMQLAFSRIKRSWNDASWISLHGRDSLPLAKVLQNKPKALAILTDPNKGGAKEVKNFLHNFELEQNYELWIFEKLGHENERITKVLANEKIPEVLDPLHLVVIIKKESSLYETKQLPLFGIEDSFFIHHEDTPNLLTKRENRIQLLADLDLPKEGVLWDIGAGVGSIGLEALRIRPNLKLISIDKRVGSKSIINGNAARLSVNPTAIIESEILTLIEEDELDEEMRSPDRVILGGGGYRRKDILNKVMGLIKPNGIIVIPLVSLEGISEIKNTLDNYNIPLKISHHQSYRGIPLADGTRLAPINPIFICKIDLRRVEYI